MSNQTTAGADQRHEAAAKIRAEATSASDPMLMVADWLDALDCLWGSPDALSFTAFKRAADFTRTTLGIQ